MYHTVREPGNMLYDTVTVSTEYLAATVETAVRLGFETITSEELLAFLTENARIPHRSMLLIVDDRYPGAIERYLLPAIEPHDWTLTLGWIIGDTGPDLWATMERLASGGRLDVQAHGLRHQPIGEWMTDDQVREELAGPMPHLLEHFGERPIAFVWPGGNFTRRSTEIAREEGYRLAFTAFARGPVMFNWVPQGPEELSVGDPVMLLPRAWSPSAIVNLEQAARLSQAAASHARASWPTEAAWFEANCGGSLPTPPD
jgi:peptidoglycan/xylan/chitin deacetylase (PgdA/CDA1 family)